MRELFKGYNPMAYFRRDKNADYNCIYIDNCSWYGNYCDSCRWTELKKEIKTKTRSWRYD